MHTFCKRGFNGMLPALILFFLCACQSPVSNSLDEISNPPPQDVPSSTTTSNTTADSDESKAAPSDDYLVSDNSDDTVTITKYTGEGGAVVIPSEIDGKKVTAIGNTFEDTGAFQNCVTVTSVIIPAGVTEIQDNAFYSCSSLITVTIPAGVMLLRNCAFADCTNLKSVYFEGNAPQIANYVFDAPSLTLYYHEGASGWTDPYYSCPTEKY